MKNEIFQLIGTLTQIPLFSDIANYKKEIHIAKYNRRGDMVMQCHHHSQRKGEMRIVIVLKGTFSVHAVNYVTSLVILRLAKVGRRPCRRYVRNTLRNNLIVRFPAACIYISSSVYLSFPLSVSLFFAIGIRMGTFIVVVVGVGVVVGVYHHTIC